MRCSLPLVWRLRTRILHHHPDSVIAQLRLLEALGSGDIDFLNGIVGQIANTALRGGKVDERGLNFMLSVIKA